MRVAVAVDDREPAGVVRALREHAEVSEVAVRRLAAGDVSVGTVGFERKTPTDFVRSAMGRTGTDLRDQLTRMHESYDHAYLLVEGDFADVEAAVPGFSSASIRGAAASLMARTGTPVVPCGSRDRLVDLAVRIGRKHAEDPGTRPLEPGAVASRREPTAKRMYGCIEGIGPEMAARLYEAYPTVADIAAATPADLRKLDGVGETRAETIYHAFNGERGE